ncbi:MAG TPA: hypothetical protein VGQ06_15345 [Gemmatimonadales bacterium]|jgi:hypothetical protein|nr:hypothetical protein [Gemmatimonadales bacterium]
MKPALGVLAALGLVAALFAAGSYWLGGGCENAPVAAVPSPDARLTAVVFVRSCRGGGGRSAAHGFATNVSIVSAGHRLGGGPGALVIMATDATPEVRVTWLGTRTLQVRYGRGAHPFKTVNHVRGVAIVYDTLP